MSTQTTLAAYLGRLAAAVAALNVRISELSEAGMTETEKAQLAQAVKDAAECKVAIANLTNTLTAMQTEVGALRSDVAVLKQGVGDLSTLPPI